MTWDDLRKRLDEIGSIEDLTERLGELGALLERFAPGEEGRAEVLTYLADEQMHLGQTDEARARYQEAIDDGGRTVLTPYAGLLDVALATGDIARADQLLELLIAKSRADELVVGDYEWIGESLEEAGRLREALRWFTIQLRDIQPGHVDMMPILCLDGRWRVRRALERPLDAYDDAYTLVHGTDEDEPDE